MSVNRSILNMYDTYVRPADRVKHRHSVVFDSNVANAYIVFLRQIMSNRKVVFVELINPIYSCGPKFGFRSKAKNNPLGLTRRILSEIMKRKSSHVPFRKRERMNCRLMCTPIPLDGTLQPRATEYANHSVQDSMSSPRLSD